MFSTLNCRKNYIKNVASSQGFLYNHESPSPNPLLGHFTDGGLLILSKYPIIEADSITYSSSTGPDKLSSKGSIYVKIEIKGFILHVFTTHMQSSYPTKDYSEYIRYRLIRRLQLQELKNFIDLKTLMKYEPVVIAGDFNVDGRENIKTPKFEVTKT